MVNPNTRIDEVDFGKASFRLRNVLYQNKVFTVGDLSRLSAKDLLKMYNFGRVSLCSVKHTLEGMGFKGRLAVAEKSYKQE